MYEVEVICDFCKKEFDRPLGRVNEAEKFGWRQFCSPSCQYASKTKDRVLVICKTCGKPIRRSKSRIESSGNAFCSSSCSIKYSNTHRVTKLTLEKRKRLQSKPVCANSDCKKQIGLENKVYCSPECRFLQENNNSKKHVISEIKKFFKKFRRVPIKYELPTLSSRARHCFGTWNKAIIASGFVPNKTIFSKRFVARDGHICDSLSEKILDDWLSARNIKHEVHIKYPWGNNMSADFKVGSYWIELFGLTGQLKRYDELMKIKLQKVSEYKLHLISIYLSDIFPINHLDKKLGVLQK